MFDIPSDPWYNYMKPFRIAMLRQVIRAQQQQKEALQQQKEAQQASQQQVKQ